MHLAGTFLHLHRGQPGARTGAPHAGPAVGFIRGAMDAAQDVALVHVQELAFLPVHFSGHVGTAVQVGAQLAFKAQHEGPRGLAINEYIPDMGAAAFEQVVTGAQGL